MLKSETHKVFNIFLNSKMKIASVNVRGLMGQLEKRHEARNAFLDFVRTENPDVVVVCEAWLAVGKNGGNIQDGKHFLKFCEKEMVEYSKYYSLKSEKRAGIVVFSKEKVDDVYRVPYWNGRFIELTITNLRLICVCIPTSVNNMHNNSKERGMLKNVLNKRLLMLKDRNKPFIVCGDFNIVPEKGLDSLNIHAGEWGCDDTGYLEYKDWGKMLEDADAVDAYRCINGNKMSYSWVAITSGGKIRALRTNHFVVSKSVEFEECYFLTDKAKRKEEWKHRPMEYFLGNDHQPIILNTGNESAMNYIYENE